MKRFILCIAIFAGGLLVSCDSDDSPNVDTPSVTLNSFQSEFPNAKDVEWEELQNGDYEAEFEINRIDHKALLNKEGNLIKYKYEILASELPELVNNAIDSNYDRSQLDDTEILKIDGKTFYQVEFDQIPMDKHVIFNEAGEESPDVEYFD